MKIHFSSIAAVVALTGAAFAAGVSPEPAFEAEGHYSTVGATLQEWRDAQVVNYSLLSRTALKADPAKTLLAELSPADFERMADHTCKTCGDSTAQRYLAGVVKETNATVAFSPTDLDGVSPSSPRATNHGLLEVKANGSVSYGMTVKSPSAAHTRIHFTNFNIPEGFKVTLYNDFGDVRGPYTGLGIHNSGDFWAHSIGGDVSYIEVSSDGSVTGEQLAQVRFDISGVAHMDANVFGPYVGLNPPESARAHCASYGNLSCTENVECYTTANFPALEDVRKGAMHYEFVIGPNVFICSANLIADTSTASEIPYAITANHCMSDESETLNAEFFFFYERNGCGASFCPSPTSFPSSLGADLLRTASTQDNTVLKLTDIIPAGAYFTGWTTTAQPASTTLYRLSFPNGAPMAYSTHNVVSTGSTCGGAPSSQFIYSTRVVGTSEGGSSGSALMTSDGKIVGQLLGCCTSFGGSCGNPCAGGTAEMDGRFSSTYTGAGTGATIGASKWLAAADLNVTIERAVGQPDITSTFPVDFDVTFSETVLSLSTVSFAFTGTSTGIAATLIPGTPTDKKWTLRVTAASDGTLIPTLPQGVVERAQIPGLVNSASTSTSNIVTVGDPAMVKGSWTAY